ncbi:uncharacterized protein LOC141896321 isoform X3 [Acropora palmata]|uniref:uncharacterized protein LOC141896321 isoform X3 n=1 Tax=Acropora palmata TaxID=6131 RepID=UPI003DA1AFAB
MWRFQSLAAVGLLLALLLLQGTFGNKAAGLRKLFLDTDPLEEMSENVMPLFEQNEGVLFSAASEASSQMPVPTAALPSASLASSQMLVVTPALSSAVAVASGASSSTVNPKTALPSECYNYAVLNQFNRAITYRGASHFCDRRLSGWYRFVGKAGSKMPHSCVTGRRCGADGPGWLVGRHPSVSEGVARRRVCFAGSRGWFYRSSCCRWSTYISVRNCGIFFVYKLRRPPTCNLRYCGDGIPPKPRPSIASSQVLVPTPALSSASLASSQMLVVTPALSSECYNYAVLDQSNRAITYRGASHFCDRRLSGWYRFVGKAGSKMPHSCVTGRRCGADGPGWLVGRHPSVSEGVARRRVCFAGSRGWFYRSSCCRWSTYISVRNCGTFFVYKLRRPPTYNLRYCGDGIHPKPRPSIASSQVLVPTPALSSASLASSQMLVVTPALSSECYNYAVLDQSNRAITYRGASHFCDRRLSGWYRFVGKAGSKMPHSCVTGRRCGADGPGWLVGRHPSVSEGVARRRVCFAGSRGWFYRSSCCRWSTYISVRNCGTFFVYKLRRPPTCNLRYCGDGIHLKPRPFIASSQVLIPTSALSSASLASSQMLVITPASSSASLPSSQGLVSTLALSSSRASLASSQMLGVVTPALSSASIVSSQMLVPTPALPLTSIASSQVLVPTPALSSASIASSQGLFSTLAMSWASTQVLVPTPALSSAVPVVSDASLSIMNPTTALPSECYNYTVLDESNRAITYPGVTYFCDNRLSGWYRFLGEAGSKMSNSCVTGRLCGADRPGWLVGDHPSVSEGVAMRRVCFASSISGGSPATSCCLWSTYVMVRNCGTFFVYKLHRPPACNLRYCGDGIPTTTRAHK